MRRCHATAKMELATATVALLGPLSVGDPCVLGVEVAALGARRRLGRFDEAAPEPRGTLTGAGRPVLAGGLVAGRSHPGPGAQMPGRREPGHVRPHLGDHHLSRGPRHSRDRAQDGDRRLERDEAALLSRR